MKMKYLFVVALIGLFSAVHHVNCQELNSTSKDYNQINKNQHVSWNQGLENEVESNDVEVLRESPNGTNGKLDEIFGNIKEEDVSDFSDMSDGSSIASNGEEDLPKLSVRSMAAYDGQIPLDLATARRRGGILSGRRPKMPIQQTLSALPLKSNVDQLPKDIKEENIVTKNNKSNTEIKPSPIVNNVSPSQEASHTHTHTHTQPHTKLTKNGSPTRPRKKSHQQRTSQTRRD